MNAMPQVNSELTILKQLLAPIGYAHQSIATTLGLLATSGIHPDEQMPEMCHLLKHIFKLKSCGFFWSDQAGNLQDAWCLTPEFLCYKTLMTCYDYQSSGTRTWPTFQENVLVGPVAGYLLPFQNERFYASSHFASSYQPINVKHLLDVVLHDGEKPFGAFLMMRSEQQGRFTPDERGLMEKLIPIMNQAFIIPSTMGKTRYAKKETTGFALIGTDGKYKSMSEEARRIVWMITHTQPGSFTDPNDPSIELNLEQLVAKHRVQLKWGGRSSIDLDNCWGRFNLMLEQEYKTQDTIATLRRQVPLASQLAFALLPFNFPPVRQIVAWLLAHNQSRNEIADALEICSDTVTDHIKLIYKVTGTSSSHGLLMRLQS
jgi:hypothetical protein